MSDVIFEKVCTLQNILIKNVNYELPDELKLTFTIRVTFIQAEDGRYYFKVMEIKGLTPWKSVSDNFEKSCIGSLGRTTEGYPIDKDKIELIFAKVCLAVETVNSNEVYYDRRSYFCEKYDCRGLNGPKRIGTFCPVHYYGYDENRHKYLDKLGEFVREIESGKVKPLSSIWDNDASVENNALPVWE